MHAMAGSQQAWYLYYSHKSSMDIVRRLFYKRINDFKVPGRRQEHSYDKKVNI